MFKNKMVLLIVIILILAAGSYLIYSITTEEIIDEQINDYQMWQIDGIKNEGRPFEGEKAPDFVMITGDEDKTTLSDYRGNIVFLNFWASWCPPCREEMPDIQKIHEKYNDEVKILAVNIREEESVVNNFMEQYELSFRAVLDSTGELAQQYSVQAIPTSIFIDPGGSIIFKHPGYISSSQIEEYIHKIAKKGN